MSAWCQLLGWFVILLIGVVTVMHVTWHGVTMLYILLQIELIRIDYLRLTEPLRQAKGPL